MQSRTYICEICGIKKTTNYNLSKKSKFRFCSVKCLGKDMSKRRLEQGRKTALKLKERGLSTCTKCKIEKPLNDFYSDNRRQTGIQSHCKECFKRQHIEFRKTNKWKQWSHIYKRKDYVREKNKEQHRLWAKTEEGKKYRKMYVQKPKFKEWERKYNKEYAKRPIAKAKDRILFQKYRVAKISSSDDTVTFEATQRLLKKQKNRCTVCNKSFDEIKKHLDHIIPITKGGKHTINNVQWLCYICNIRKSNKLPDLQNLGYISNY